MERRGNILRRSRLAAGLLAGSLLLGACAQATTNEGVSTADCIPGTATYKMHNGSKIYLGDFSSDPMPFNGVRSDWASIKDSLGQIVTEQQKGNGDARDSGVFSQTKNGVKYRENGHEYDVQIGDEAADHTLPVTVVTNC